MSNRSEIQKAIEQLPKAEVLELAHWLENLVNQEPSAAYRDWIKKARGAAIPGVTTDEIMALNRGE